MVLRRLLMPLALLALFAVPLSIASAEDEPAPAAKPAPVDDTKPGAEPEPAAAPAKKKLVRQPTLWVVEGTP